MLSYSRVWLWSICNDLFYSMLLIILIRRIIIYIYMLQSIWFDKMTEAPSHLANLTIHLERYYFGFVYNVLMCCLVLRMITFKYRNWSVHWIVNGQRLLITYSYDNNCGNQSGLILTMWELYSKEKAFMYISVHYNLIPANISTWYA